MTSSKDAFNRRAFICKSSFLLAGLLKAQPATGSGNNGLRENTISSLSGILDVHKLGTTLMHEHVLFGNIPDNLRSASVNIAVKMLNEATKAGVETIVDVSPYRDINLYRDIEERTTINIIASTGYYKQDSTPSALVGLNESAMEERIYREVTEGIEGTKIRAGIIKVAADDVPIPEWNKKVFRAAARVQKATGVPIATHAWIGAKEQFDLLVKTGANPNHINLSHVDTVNGWGGKTREKFAAELLPVVQAGGFLLFNNFSCEFYTPWVDLVYLLRFYCDQGYAHRILISEDCNWEWKNGKQVFEAEEAHPEAAKRTYSYMMTHEVPLMRQAGFTKKDMKTFLIDNPRNFFSTKF